MSNKRDYQALTIPKLTWNKETFTTTYGELSAAPLEPGFGITLGNALRRILLGGIEGSAVTAVVIKGVNNEFSVLPGVIDDAMQVILNCKQIVIKNKTGKPGIMKLRVSDKTEARVSDIVADEHLELLNKNHVIANLAEQGSVEIDFYVEPGRGYQAAKWPIGTGLQNDGKIYLDAMYSPVRKVTFEVEKTRVGRDIDYDRLLLALTTDGTQSPHEVVHYAVSVLRTQLEHFLDTPEIAFNDISRKISEEAAIEVPVNVENKLQGVPLDLLSKPIDALEFSVRAHNCLVNAGITRIVDLVNLTEDEVLKIKNFGRKSYDEVKEAMKGFGLTFGMNVQESDLKALEYAGEKDNHETSER